MSYVFEQQNQALNIDDRLVTGLERIGGAFSTIMMQENRKHNLSPLQLQILTFLFYHGQEFCTISNIATEFDLTKATISNAVKGLGKKGYILKEKSLDDFRSSTINLSATGNKIAQEISGFTDKIKNIISLMAPEKKELFLEGVLEIMHNLFDKEIICARKNCLNCKYYVRPDNDEEHICALIAGCPKT